MVIARREYLGPQTPTADFVSNIQNIRSGEQVQFEDRSEPVLDSLRWYFSFYVIFFSVSWLVGLCARALLPEVSSFDSELALPTIAESFLPPILVGVILAGLFAAAISTADSLVLSASAALSRDILKRPSVSMWVTKGSTILISCIVLGISLWGNKSV